MNRNDDIALEDALSEDWAHDLDIVEVPLVIMICLGSLLILGVGPGAILLVGSIAFLCLLELFFSFVMIKNILKAIFFSGVMFLRAFARTFGFSTGFLQIFVKKT